MAEPSRLMPHRAVPRKPLDEEEDCGGIIQRLVKRPDGSIELVDLPLTPELFLNPGLEDRMVQGGPHSKALFHLQELLFHHFRSEKGTLVFSDVQLRLGKGLPSPVPDIWVVRGHPSPDFDIRSYNLPKEKVPPCLIVEVVSEAAKLRRVDELDKVKLYERAGVRDYLMAELPRRSTGGRFRLLGLSLGSDGRYQPMATGEQGRLLSGATGLWFGLDSEGKRIEAFDARTGEPLRTMAEEAEARKQEAEARKRAEAEVERLRAEIERLKATPPAGSQP